MQTYQDTTAPPPYQETKPKEGGIKKSIQFVGGKLFSGGCILRQARDPSVLLNLVGDTGKKAHRFFSKAQ
ncbi:hypothetical protein [Absidia glauca]|uniref:Uncharacterized protein n=1 Tax=Absidia glauca TaxID=4829 RepID=A0A168RFF7_ABSGL|nr:hypothetical protein [Absidia glauca]